MTSVNESACPVAAWKKERREGSVLLFAVCPRFFCFWGFLDSLSSFFSLLFALSFFFLSVPVLLLLQFLLGSAMENVQLSAGQRVLIVSDDPKASACTSAISQVEASGASATVLEVSQLESQETGSNLKFDAAFLHNLGTDDDAYAAVFDRLTENSDAIVTQSVVAPAAGGSDAGGEQSDVKAIADAVLLGGFSFDSNASQSTSGGLFVIHAKVPSWSGEAVALPKQAPTSSSAASVSENSSSARAIFASLANDFDDGAHDVVDEDALLGEAPAAPKSAGCPPAKPGTRKRACKNCTCGTFAKLASEVVVSACFVLVVEIVAARPHWFHTTEMFARRQPAGQVSKTWKETLL